MRIHHCSNCTNTGHNERSCPEILLDKSYVKKCRKCKKSLIWKNHKCNPLDIPTQQDNQDFINYIRQIFGASPLMHTRESGKTNNMTDEDRFASSETRYTYSNGYIWK